MMLENTRQNTYGISKERTNVNHFRPKKTTTPQRQHLTING
ncbi:hypothetical protein SLEP1_g43635 [Rubroshorea leprosula]|uniref:Ribosomal protein L33 n=1 Tax=Rubroshorea leprosula TaxID=152421 RepID=A0AAV5LDZ7_9ROSI|nr:hypothetical protein SLEP1_g43635 [Rubroshorea leprosula]